MTHSTEIQLKPQSKNQLKPQSEKKRPETFSEVNNWNVGDWTTLPEGKPGIFFVKTGQHKNISLFKILDPSLNVVGKTQGLSFKGEKLF
jgi:hypothetical protein